MYLKRRKTEWWEEPTLAPRKVHVPRSLRNLDPVNSGAALPETRQSRIGAFAPTRQWVRYGDLSPLDAGYIVPLYDLRDIAKRYGLSQRVQRYFRKYILPEPYDIVRRRSVQAHHWSRFTLMALDVVLTDLEQRGWLQFKKQFTEHIDLLHTGTSYLTELYAEIAEEQIYETTDEFGVRWD